MPSSEVKSATDAITPSLIDHCVDEGFDAETGELLFHYNFLHYSFDHPRGEVRARSYLWDIGKVALYLPKGAEIGDPVMTRIVAYLARRYNSIQRFDGNAYVDVPAAE